MNPEPGKLQVDPHPYNFLRTKSLLLIRYIAKKLKQMQQIDAAGWT